MIKVFFKAYSSLFFCESYYLGVFLFFVSFINYSVAIFGIFSILTTILFAKFIDIQDKEFLQGFYIYNSLLIGMSIGYIFVANLVSLFLVILLSILTFLLSFFLNRMMDKYGLAILSIPFSLVSFLLYLISFHYPSLFLTYSASAMLFDIEMPLLLSALFKAIGSILFLPNNVVGLCILILLFFYSRIMFLLMVLGFYFGVSVHALLLDSFMDALLDKYAFNYSITALALGGIFLLPTKKNFILTLLAVALTVLVVDSLNGYFNYYLIAFPFNFVVTLFVFLLYFFNYKELNYFPQSTPEQSLIYYLSNLFRFAPRKIQIMLPFSGEWKVYQAFNGEWTHQGAWKYAYDFIIEKEDKSYQNSGNSLEDYYCFGEAVLSPINGVVIDCNDTLPDNFIGQVNQVNNWGNYIILQTNDGFFVEISHLMQYSLRVKVGDLVRLQTPLGKCGNSGYSSQPHIHIQVQETASLGSPTIMFCFYEFMHRTKLNLHTVPQINETVRPLIVNQYVVQKFSFFLNETYYYDVYKNGEFIETFIFVVKINNENEYFFEDKQENQLFFYKTQSQFYFYKYKGGKSYLLHLHMLMPRVPLTQEKVSYTDYLACDLLYSPWKKSLLYLKIIFYPHVYMYKQTYLFHNNCLHSSEGKVFFSDDFKSPYKIFYQDFELISKRK